MRSTLPILMAIMFTVMLTAIVVGDSLYQLSHWVAR